MKLIDVVAAALLAALPALAAAYDPAPTVRSKTEIAAGELVVSLELVHAKRAMYISSFEAPRARVDALGLGAPAGFRLAPSAEDPAQATLAGRLDLAPGKPVVLRFPMKKAAGGTLKLHGTLEYGGGVEQEGEMFLFDVVWPCPVFREGPAWGEVLPPACAGGKP